MNTNNRAMRRMSTSASNTIANLANSNTRKHSARNAMMSSIRRMNRDNQNNKDKREVRNTLVVGVELSLLPYDQR